MDSGPKDSAWRVVVAQWVEVFATKPGDQSSIPQTHIGGRKDLSPLNCLSTCSVHPLHTVSKDVLRESIQQEQTELWKGGERAAHRFFLSLPHCPSKTTFLKSFHNQQGFGVFILFP